MNNSKIKQVALYARVSSDKQAEKELPIDAQIKELRNYASKRDWLITHTFVDEGISGMNENRPEFQKMVQMIQNKNAPFQAILLWKFNRLFREREHSVVYKKLIRKKGVEIISITEPIDKSNQGRFLEGMLELFDEHLLGNIAQDTFRGMKENAEQGNWNGGKPPIGYKIEKIQDGKNSKNKLLKDDNYAPVVARIFKMYTDGRGIKEIANVLNLEGLKTDLGNSWGKSIIHGILKNEVYIGTLVFGKTDKSKLNIHAGKEIIPVRKKNNHEAIIDEATLIEVGKIINSKATKNFHPREVSSEYLLSGVLYCGKCGYKMIGAPGKSSQYFYYRCNNFHKKGLTACDSKLINRDVIDSAVLDAVMNHIITDKNIEMITKLTNRELRKINYTNKEEIRNLEKRVNERGKKLYKLYDALETGKIGLDELSPRIREHKREIESMSIKKIQLENELHNSKIEYIDSEKVKKYVKEIIPIIQEGTTEQKKEIIRSFIKKISLIDCNITFEYIAPTKKKEYKLMGLNDYLLMEDVKESIREKSYSDFAVDF